MDIETFNKTYDKNTVEKGVVMIAAATSKAFMDLQFMLNVEALKRDPDKAKAAIMQPIDLMDMTEILEDMLISKFKEILATARNDALESINAKLGYEK